jgi:hypothetical protein
LTFAPARTARLVLAAVLAAALVACTFTKFAYNQADTLMAWLADDYFDLDSQQKTEFQKRFERFYAWHRYEQLPEYARFMKTARTRMQDGLSHEDVMWFVDGLKARTRLAGRKAAVEAAPLLATLTPAQIENLQRKWAKANSKYVRERKVEGTLDERYEAEGKRIAKHLKEWLAPLTNEQEARVIQLTRELPQLERERYAERLRRQKEFLEVLSHRHEDLPRFTQRLTDWMVHWERGRSAEYQRQIDASWQKRADLFVAIDRMLTPEQRTVSLQRLETYASDFTQLAQR